MANALNLNQLRYFYEVAKSKNMKRAASRIGVSQPALSKQVHALEEFLGLQLFFRSSRGMQPTPEGEVVYAHCERVFGHVRDLEEAIDGLRNGSAGRVAIGAVNSIGIHILPLYLRRFRERNPGVQLKLVTSKSQQVLQALREHRVDVGLVAGSADGDDLVTEPFLSNRLRVVVAPDHPLSKLSRREGALQPEVLDAEPMVAFDSEAPTRGITDAALRELDVEPNIVAESPDIEVIKRMVEVLVGFAVVPEHCIRRELSARTLVALDIEGFALKRDLCVVYRAGSAPQPAVQSFLDLLLRRGSDSDSDSASEDGADGEASATDAEPSAEAPSEA